MATKTKATIIEKTGGVYVDVAFEANKIVLGDDEMTLNLSKYERDDPVHIDIGLNSVKLLGIAPPGEGLEGDILYVRNNGERLPLRGGRWTHQTEAGVFALALNEPRARSGDDFGFRAAFVNL